MSDEAVKCKCKAGLPAWLATFADLMSLLMCFFVLLLSFSEMDVLKFKQIAGSMKFAFGVQNKMSVKDIPKGSSVVAREFAPGKPIPTPINTIMQHTTEVEQRDVRTGDQNYKSEDPDSQSSSTDDAAAQQQMEQQARLLAEQIATEIAKGQVEIEAKNRMIVIRIREKGSFPSGTANVRRNFIPILQKIRDMLVKTNGSIVVSGHTDNIPIRNQRFSSNWELSAARAVAVAHELLKSRDLDKARVTVNGHADTKPLVPNTDAANRAQNRRVEIALIRGNSASKEMSFEDSEKEAASEAAEEGSSEAADTP